MAEFCDSRMTTWILFPTNVFIVCVFLSTIYGYNLDTNSPIIYRGEEGSYFGFSVAIHRDSGEDMVIVGAPLADANARYVERGGSVYRCSILPYNISKSCEKILLQNGLSSSGGDRNKSGEWLGATVQSSGSPYDQLLSCAPFSQVTLFAATHRSGRCVISSSNFTRKVTLLHLCRPDGKISQYGRNDIKDCQAGMSGDIFKGRYAVGAPTSPKSRGFVLTNTTKLTLDDRKPLNDDYEGYAITHGNFDGPSGDVISIVAGSPRYSNLFGKVSIYKQKGNKLKQTVMIMGQQLGSYFGSSVAVSDLNNDGFDDLIVGSPSYWNRETQQINVGQIHVFYQTSWGVLNYESSTVITGQVTNGRFGFKIAALGDINDDGFNDLAVSAPFDEDGAIFIFNGKMEKINATPSQVLRPVDFGLKLGTFGYALVGNRDADQNQYPDLLVGAYSSDAAVLVRTRPIVRPEITIETRPQELYLSKEHRRNSSTNPIIFNITTCVSYTGRGTADSYTFIAQLDLDAQKLKPRAIIQGGNESRIQEIDFNVNNATIPECKVWTAVLKDIKSFPDRVSPIAIRMSLRLQENESALADGELASLMEMREQYQETQVTIYYKCMNNETCASDLALSVESDTEKMYLGDTDHVTINVTVANRADDAFGAYLYAHIPSDFKFHSYKTIMSELSIQCIAASIQTVIACDIGNPLSANKTISFTMSFSVPRVQGETETAVISLNVTSLTHEHPDTMHNNKYNITIPLELDLNTELIGTSNIDKFVYRVSDSDTLNDQITHENQIGGEIIHRYRVVNFGPAAVERGTLAVEWPKTTADGSYLLYLTQVHITNNYHCEIIGGSVNPANVTLSVRPLELVVDTGVPAELMEPSRRRRGVGNEPQLLLQPTQGLLDGQPYQANCSNNFRGCVTILCNVTNLVRDEQHSTQLTIRSRLWSANIQNDDSRPWQIVSSARFTVDKVPYVLQPDELHEKTSSLSLLATPSTKKLMLVIPMWSIILAVISGHVFVLIIIIVLCKCGFFKRKKINRQYLQIETCPLEEGDSNSMTQAENGDGSLKHQKKMNIVHLDYADVRGNSRIE